MASSSSPSSGAPAWRIRSPLKRSRRSPAQQPPPLAPPGEELKEEGHWPVRPGQTSPGREDSGGPARPRNKCFPQLCGRGEGAVPTPPGGAALKPAPIGSGGAEADDDIERRLQSQVAEMRAQIADLMSADPPAQGGIPPVVIESAFEADSASEAEGHGGALPDEVLHELPIRTADEGALDGPLQQAVAVGAAEE